MQVNGLNPNMLGIKPNMNLGLFLDQGNNQMIDMNNIINQNQ